MVDHNDGGELVSRIPTLDDLLFLCRKLNEAGARYVVIGGWAVIQHGFGRTTQDIDLLVDSSPDNFERIRTAMLALPDGAIREVKATDLDEFVVVRIADEVLVDLMKRACGVEYAEASKDVCLTEVRGVPVPFANPKLLLRLKQTHREKDAEDRLFLQRLIHEQEKRQG